MDSTTLESLKSAFNAAPSAELAKVIAMNSLNEESTDLSAYLPYLKNTLSDDEASSLADFLMSQGKTEDAVDTLDSSRPNQVLKQVEIYIAIERQAEAKQLYLELIALNPNVSNTKLDEVFGIEANPSELELARSKSERPKLRIVEKNESADIEDLTRYREKTTNFSDVVGLIQIKKLISKKIIMPFQKPGLFQRFKKKVGGGVLLYGPPGCGKTLLARATAGECNASFYNIEVSDVLDMYIGESEQKLHAIFEKARHDTPCVLFFDELEALAGKREYNKGNASNIVSQFLSELDGFSQNNEGVLVLASTNVPWSIDSAFLRPGRFDRMFFVPPPDKQARRSILEYYLKDKPTEGSIDYDYLVTRTSGYSGADLENLVEIAADEAIDEILESGEETSISNVYLKTALKECRSTTLEWLTTARNYARYANDGGRYDDVLEFLKKNGK